VADIEGANLLNPGDLDFDPEHRRVRYRKEDFFLKPSEILVPIMERLSRKAPYAVHREALIEAGWGPAFEGSESTLNKALERLNDQLRGHGLYVKSEGNKEYRLAPLAVDGGSRPAPFLPEALESSPDVAIVDLPGIEPQGSAGGMMAGPAPVVFRVHRTHGDSDEIDTAPQGEQQAWKDASLLTQNKARLKRCAGTPTIRRVRFSLLLLISLLCLLVAGDTLTSGRSANPVPTQGVVVGSLPRRAKIIVFEFKGPDPMKYMIGSTIATALTHAKDSVEEEVEIEGLPQAISATGDAGVKEARRIGRERNATAVIWGYMGTTRRAPVYASFVPVDEAVSIPSMPAEFSAWVPVPLKDLEHLRTQAELSRDFGTLVRLAIGLGRWQRGDMDGFAEAMDRAIRSNPVDNKLIDPNILRMYHALAMASIEDFAKLQNDLTQIVDTTKDSRLLALALSQEGQLFVERRDYIKFNAVCQRVRSLAQAPIDAIGFCGLGYWAFGDQKGSSMLTDSLLNDPHPTPKSLPMRTFLHLSRCEIDKAKEDIAFAEKAGQSPSYFLTAVDLGRLSSNEEHSSDLFPAISPESARFALLEDAASYIRLERPDLAKAAISRLLEQSPSSTAYLLRAGAYELSGGHDFEDIDRAIALEPGNSTLYYLLGSSHAETGQYPEAVNDFSKALSLDPTDAEAEFQLANVLFKVGREDDSYNHLQNAVRIQPTYADAFVQWGIHRIQDEAYSEAVQQLTKAIELYKSNDPPFGWDRANELGPCPPDNGRSRRKTEALALGFRASTNMKMQNLSLAENDVREALRLNPEDAFAHANASILAGERRDYETALKEIDDAIRLDGEEPGFRSARQGILDAMKQHKSF